MSIKFNIDAEPRQDVGKGASRRLRRAGKIPAIVYGGHQDPEMITLVQSEFVKSLANEAVYSSILDLNVGGRKQQVILKALQRHPIKPIIEHADFQRVSASEKLTIHVPLHFLNEETCVGVKQGGGRISHQLIEVEVSCLPADMPEFIEVDLAALNLGEALHLSDLKLPQGVEILALSHGNDMSVVSVQGKGGGAEEEEEGEAEGEAEAEA
ncbi:50S ribosomal protein L25/general stress protein Ctc [Thioalbus denitrificans]|uniref:Large ribosomal subunit protein bL25 n=1 Tax=Thioalbus denitrificans TaxID=547122 RepID=A0A369CLA4_9GAMM|nr:50S ribosomal protein L25/general stress protein Ctc [Thioalbus denitrificans]RCX33207.1 LSU ribosomal protein L25P [Thioalbus denitrificans]